MAEYCDMDLYREHVASKDGDIWWQNASNPEWNTSIFLGKYSFIVASWRLPMQSPKQGRALKIPERSTTRYKQTVACDQKASRMQHCNIIA